MTERITPEVIELARLRGLSALRIVGVACIASAAVFIALPQIDLGFSALFFHASAAAQSGAAGFYPSAPFSQFFDLVDRLGRIALIGSIVAALFFRLTRNKYFFPSLLICLSLVLGPALTVNAVLKTHWDRARPSTIVEFGGTQRFTSAWIISDQCHHNCSFTSGHAAAGFAPVVGHFISRRKGWLIGGVLLGAGIGLTRIMVGAHFLSDVVFSFFVVYLAAGLVSWGLATRWQSRKV